MKWAFLALYIAVIAVVAVLSSRKVRNLSDFHLGGRSIGPWLSAFAYGTTYFSAVIFIGYAGNLGWKFGTAAVWIGIGNALFGSLLVWKLLANKTRLITTQLGATTMPEFLEKRFDSKWLKIACAVVIFVFLTPYSASVYQGLGYLFEKTFNIPFEWCMVMMAAVTLSYLLLGGYLATVWIDFIQGLFMIAGVVLMIVFLFKNMGGVGPAFEQLKAIDAAKTTVLGADPQNLLWLVLLTSFGAWGLPQMVHKFYAVKDEKSVKTGTIISTLFALLIGGCAYLFGAFGPVLLGNVKPENVDTIIPTMLSIAMPDALIGLIVVLVLSASMSTLASLVMVSSSAISIDLFKGVLFPKMSEKTTKGWMRLLCAAFVLISLGIALLNNANIVTMMSFSWGTVAGCILGPYVFGVLWKGATKQGAFAGFFSGLAVSLILAFTLGAAQAPFTGCMAMLASAVVTPIVSLCTRKRELTAQNPAA